MVVKAWSFHQPRRSTLVRRGRPPWDHHSFHHRNNREQGQRVIVLQQQQLDSTNPITSSSSSSSSSSSMNVSPNATTTTTTTITRLSKTARHLIQQASKWQAQAAELRVQARALETQLDHVRSQQPPPPAQPNNTTTTTTTTTKAQQLVQTVFAARPLLDTASHCQALQVERDRHFNNTS